MSDYKKYGEYSRDTRESSSVKIAVTFLAIGAAAGALVSLLLSPRSGSEIRQAVRGKIDEARRGLNDQTSRLRRRTAGWASEAREKVTSIARTS